MKPTYLAGPMTGLPDFNYPAFNAEAARLRAMGIEVLNPAENTAPACGSWGAYMRLALAQLILCDSIVLLPGWELSRGARVEAHLADQLNMDMVFPDDSDRDSAINRIAMNAMKSRAKG